MPQKRTKKPRVPAKRGSHSAPPTNAFQPGNPGGKGNPFAGAVMKLRSALLAAVTEDDMKAIARALILKARKGDVPAIKELFDRTLGKSVQPIDFGDNPITVKMYGQEAPVGRV